MTKAKSDYDKALSRAIKSLVAALVCTDAQEAVEAVIRAEIDATIIAHWYRDAYECECHICLGDYTIHH